MTDFTQPFHDSYFDFPIYLHGLIVGCTYNDEEKLIPHLRDRLRPQAIEIGAPNTIQRRQYFERFLVKELDLRKKTLQPITADVVQSFDRSLGDIRSLRALQGHARKLAQVVIDRNPDGAEAEVVALTLLNLSEAFATPQISICQFEELHELPRGLRYHDWNRLSYRAIVPQNMAEDALAVRWTSGSAIVEISVRQLSAVGLPLSKCGHQGSCAVLLMLNNRLFCLRVRGKKKIALQGWPICDEIIIPLHGYYALPTLESEPHLEPLGEGLNASELDVLMTDCLLI